MKNFLELTGNLVSKNYLNFLLFVCSLVFVSSNNLNAQCASAPSANVYNYKICEGNTIPNFEVDEIITDKTYQLDDGDLERSYGTGQDNIPFTWGNMFEIKAEDCAFGCSFAGFEAVFRNMQGELVNWFIYTDDDGDPTAGLSSPLASGNHTVNNGAATNEVLNSIVVNNIDLCATIDTMPFLFISFSYVGTSFPASIDTTSSNMQSWVTFTSAGTQADWSSASSSLIDDTSLVGGNWLIRANFDCPPCTINWYDAPTAGNLLGGGNTFSVSNKVSEEGAAVDSTNIGIYTFYAETQCNNCINTNRKLFSLEVEDCCPANLSLPTGTALYEICAGDDIPIFELDETYFNGNTESNYQLDDGTLELSYGSGQDSIPFTWGNMFQIKAENCGFDCSFINMEAAFGNAQGELITWHIYTDDDGDPTAGLSTPLASGNHTVVNNGTTTNSVLDNILINNIDICSTINTMPFLFISFSYTGALYPASVDNTTSNMQSWVTFAGNGSSADWASTSASLIDNTSFSGGNWIIRANLSCPPCTINWYDAPVAGNLLGSGNTFEASNQISEEGLAVDSTNIGIYTFYAETHCNNCISNIRRSISLEVEDCCPAVLNSPTGTDLYEICAGDDIPIFELDEDYLNGNAESNYQLDDGALEQFYGSGQDSIPFTWGNMFQIKLEDCVSGCSIISLEADFGNTTSMEESVSWYIYTDDDGDPRAGLSSPLATGNHTVVNNSVSINGALDSIVVNNIDVCASINTMPYLFISFSYVGTSYPASIDNTTSNMQSWRTFTSNGTQADWASSSTTLTDDSLLPGGNWLIRANLTCPPCTINWYDAPTAGNLLGSGNTFEAGNQVSEEGAAVDSTNVGTYTFYAETQCNTCISNTRKSISLEVEDCCPAELNFPNTVTHNMDETFEASSKITSAATVDSTVNVTYLADSIHLNIGFKVPVNTNFRAAIGGCDP